jgi:hypothetical protein
MRVTGAFFTNSLMEAENMRITVKLARVKTVVSLVYLISLIAALSLATGIATAGARTHDYEFTLPCRAYWNSIPLRAGNYTFTLDRTGPETRVLLRREGRAVAILLTSNGFLDKGSSDSDALTLTPGNGTYYVSALSVPDRDLTLYYPAPKAAGEHKLQVREAMQKVFILPAGR